MNRTPLQAMSDQVPGKNAYWHPFSPAFTWPARLFGALMLVGYGSFYLTSQSRLSTDPHPPLTSLVLGLFFFLTSFRHPVLRSLTKGDILLRRVTCAVLIVLIAGLAISLISFL